MKNINTHKTWQLLGTLKRPTYYTLMDKVVLGDRLIVSFGGSLYKGIVTFISIRGVNVELMNDPMFPSHKFIKWENVLEKVDEDDIYRETSIINKLKNKLKLWKKKN